MGGAAAVVTAGVVVGTCVPPTAPAMAVAVPSTIAAMAAGATVGGLAGIATKKAKDRILNPPHEHKD